MEQKCFNSNQFEAVTSIWMMNNGINTIRPLMAGKAVNFPNFFISDDL